MEKDDEVKGGGNSYDFGARMYDARVGRWLTIDPLAMKYPDLSPYNFVANSPLIFIDPNGKEIIIYGSVEDFKNLKLVIEKHFENMIEISIDDKNRLTMNFKEYNPENTTLSKEEWDEKVNSQLNKPSYSILSDMITNKEKAYFQIFSDSKNYHGGGFRGGALEGEHYIDVGDALKRIDWIEASGIGLIMHEFYEGYYDQVILNSPMATNSIEQNSIFEICHKKGLEVQAKVNNYDSQYNQGNWSDNFGLFSRVFSVKKNECGEDEWTMTEFYQNSNKKQEPTLIRECVKIKNVKLNNDKTKVIDYEEE